MSDRLWRNGVPIQPHVSLEKKLRSLVGVVRLARTTLKWAKRLNPDTAQFQLANVLEGTPFHAELTEKGWLNSDGEPDYPHFSNEDIRAAAKRAYRAFYLSPQHLLKCIRHPYELFFGRFKTMSAAVPAMFWKRW